MTFMIKEKKMFKTLLGSNKNKTTNITRKH